MTAGNPAPGAVAGPATYRSADQPGDQPGEQPDAVHRAFVDAVTRQLTSPPGATAAGVREHELSVRGALAAILDAAAAGPASATFAAAARALADDTALLSSVFQNLDLFGVEDAAGRGVALLVAAALDG